VYTKNCKLLKTNPTAVGLLTKINEVYKVKGNIGLAKTKTVYDTIIVKVG
jgi:hypothetical protein